MNAIKKKKKKKKVSFLLGHESVAAKESFQYQEN
jgi:hypothetical protein